MGCGFKFDNRDLIIKLLIEKNNFDDLTSSGDNDLSSWSLQLNVNNIAVIASRLTNNKNNSKSNSVTSRTYFGYKSSNKVNNYAFRHYKTSENYMTQYRNENKSLRCLSYNDDVYDTSTVPVRADVLFEGPISNIISHKSQTYSSEKPLIHQVRFWQNQNPLNQPIGEVNQMEEVSRINNTLNITASKSNTYTQKSTFNTKRNLDMMIPQGTTYDILSDEINQKDDPEKLNVKIGDIGSGLVNVPYSHLRDSTKIRRFTKVGGSLEFAKLLDEKLRQLYEQRALYQPIIEINRIKPETKHTKSLSRLKSACQFKERPTQNSSLNSLSVNGQSAGSRFIHPSQRLTMSSERQCTCSNPCLLPQMPSFGMHNFPKCIVYHKCVNSKCEVHDNEE